MTSALLLFAALLQDRPEEADIFGAPPPPAEEASSEIAAPASHDREEAIFGGAEPAPTPADEEKAPENPLTVGGKFYLRSEAAAKRNTPASKWLLTAPLLVDGYFDARPNDRVRGMLLARMRFNPTADPDDPNFLMRAKPGPTVSLDQLWMRFDVGRTLFVTAGRQHVKWGTARFWNPTDYLHSERRDPLALFDVRSGVTMLKAHVPWEARGWNFYAVGLLDNLAPANTIGRVGGAARAELVFGDAELGLDGIWQRGRKPRYGIDLSAGVGPFDLYGEVALRRGGDRPRWSVATVPDLTQGVAGFFEEEHLTGWNPAATVGGSWSYNYTDTDVLTLGFEYFYNPSGYEVDDDDRDLLYPWLIYQGDFAPFYLGKQYAGLYVVLMAPGDWNNTTFILSALGNISDRSYITRLDYVLVALTHMRFEAYGAAHFGKEGGEFRFGIEIDQPGIPRIVVPTPTVELGVGLRIDI